MLLSLSFSVSFLFCSVNTLPFQSLKCKEGGSYVPTALWLARNSFAQGQIQICYVYITIACLQLLCTRREMEAVSHSLRLSPTFRLSHGSIRSLDCVLTFSSLLREAFFTYYLLLRLKIQPCLCCLTKNKREKCPVTFLPTCILYLGKAQLKVLHQRTSFGWHQPWHSAETMDMGHMQNRRLISV